MFNFEIILLDGPRNREAYSCNLFSQTKMSSFDSTLNFVVDKPQLYIGQDLYLSKDHVTCDQCQQFLLDPLKARDIKSNIYKCDEGFFTKRSAIAGKTFKVLGVVQMQDWQKNIELGITCFLKLQEKESGDIIYFEHSIENDLSFPFIVMGFYNKQKSLVVGKEFVFADKRFKKSKDLITGNPITIVTGQKWKCLDLLLDSNGIMTFLVQNPIGEKTTVHYERIFGYWFYGVTYSAAEADEFRKKFGDDKFNKILQGNIEIGMTVEMTELALGKNWNKRQETKVGDVVTAEQVYYTTKTLYFENGILTKIE